MKLNCKRIDFTYTPGEEIFNFPEESGLPFIFDIEKELTGDPAAMDAVGEMLDEAEKLAEKAKAAIKGDLTRQEAERLLTFCNNSNPVFLISVLGVGVFGSVRAGLWLWLIHVCAALLTGLLFRGLGRGRKTVPPAISFQAPSLPAAFVSSVRDSAGTMLSVCAFVTFFYVLISPLTALPGPWAALAVGCGELFSLTPLLPCDRTGFLLAAGCAGWGGLSVLCQTAALLDGTDLPLAPCLLGKLTHGLLSALLAALVSLWLF